MSVSERNVESVSVSVLRYDIAGDAFQYFREQIEQ